jgi:serine-type D-Ala-D-Ala carboxypeptidase
VPKVQPPFAVDQPFAINQTSLAIGVRVTTSLQLAPAYTDQDTRFKAAYDILRNAIPSRAFPAASVSITMGNNLLGLRAFGRFTFEPQAPETTPETIFDLASVSKAIATTTMSAILYERGLLDLEIPLTSIVGEFAGEDPRRDEVTLRMLLAHSSGLPAYEKLYLRADSRESLLAAAFSVPLANDPGSHAEYSDIGFILLGVALERLADDSLDHFSQSQIFGPLGLAHTTFTPPHSWRDQVAPTADDRTFRHRIIQGEVQDENASVMGGVAGHAGVFSTASDCALFARSMLPQSAAKRKSSQPEDELPATPTILRPETIALFTERQSSPEGTSRALGWDTPSPPSQSGHHFSQHAYGHLGYTGTSLWIDPERDLTITLLTNRTWPDCANQAIKQIRPRFYDAVVEAL